MRRERPAAVRHRPPGAEWWSLTLPELEGLVDRGDHEAAYRFSSQLLEALEAQRGCGPRHGPAGVGTLDACAACQAVDRAAEKVIELQLAARLSAPMSWAPDADATRQEIA